MKNENKRHWPRKITKYHPWISSSVYRYEFGYILDFVSLDKISIGIHQYCCIASILFTKGKPRCVRLTIISDNITIRSTQGPKWQLPFDKHRLELTARSWVRLISLCCYSSISPYLKYYFAMSLRLGVQRIILAFKESHAIGWKPIKLFFWKCIASRMKLILATYLLGCFSLSSSMVL